VLGDCVLTIAVPIAAAFFDTPDDWWLRL